MLDKTVSGRIFFERSSGKPRPWAGPTGQPIFAGHIYRGRKNPPPGTFAHPRGHRRVTPSLPTVYKHTQIKQ